MSAELRTIFERWAILTSDGRIAVDGNGLCIFNSIEIATHTWILMFGVDHFRVARVRLVELPSTPPKGERA